MAVLMKKPAQSAETFFSLCSHYEPKWYENLDLFMKKHLIDI